MLGGEQRWDVKESLSMGEPGFLVGMTHTTECALIFCKNNPLTNVQLFSKEHRSLIPFNYNLIQFIVLAGRGTHPLKHVIIQFC